ncbi:class I SAM-dependent methyltransferase [Odoribacter laneus]|uniref:class I SAM-dependent methyltransferase n=2 Tax=Odoribacter laneus TaxID=626933 RepID=UPI00399452B9
MNIKLISPTQWKDYELIDSGHFEKLERFGPYLIARPEPQALWNKSLSEAEWTKRADAYFRKDKRNEEKGEWQCKPLMPQQWFVTYQYQEMHLRMRLGLTSFKHVGLFPEQAENWNFIYSQIKGMPVGAKVLNLFAYTGGATLAARSAGAEVTHVDSVKPVVNWSRENMEASGLNDVRWIVDDALKFVRREVKRGKKYNGILLDPPAYGRGPDGEKWILEENLNELLSLCKQLLTPEQSFLVLNLYSMGLSALLARTTVQQLIGEGKGEQFGELYFRDSFGKSLPLGVYYRFWR